VDNSLSQSAVLVWGWRMEMGSVPSVPIFVYAELGAALIRQLTQQSSNSSFFSDRNSQNLDFKELGWHPISVSPRKILSA